MSDSSSFTDRERADLVAYLDGELKGEAARKIEAKLARDPAARDEADGFRRAWDMLDFLPRPAPSPRFANETLEKISPVRITGSPLIVKRRWTNVVLTAGWAAALILAIGLGYGGSRIAPTRGPGDQELVRDLRVIENKRLYDAADDLDLVRELDAPELFGEDAVGT
jgi:anti-sigma factor RsiW